MTTKKTRPALAELGISTLYPAGLRRALMDAENWPRTDRLQRIDKLTLEAARLGLARLPSADDGWVPPTLLQAQTSAQVAP